MSGKIGSSAMAVADATWWIKPDAPNVRQVLPQFFLARKA
jgi:hypothetical protein